MSRYRIIRILKFYWNVVIKGNANYLYYYKRAYEAGNGFDNWHYGYEIINSKTNKVVIRKGRQTDNLDSNRCQWEEVNCFFFRSIT